MKSILSVTLCFLFSCLIIFSSCKKAGTGGKATLVVFLQHHGKTIPNHTGYPDTVFVKYNAKELPGTTAADFDTYFVGEEGEDHVHCTELKPGNYFIYGAGMDTTGPYRVTGGIAVKIKSSDKENEIDTDLPVTE